MHRPSAKVLPDPEDGGRGHDDTVQAAAAASKDFLFQYAVMLTIGIVGASPRALVLLLSSSLPSVSVDQALSDFPALWAPCAEEGAAFSAYSPDGALYTYLIVSDRAIMSGFMTLAFVAGLATLVPESAGAQSRRWNRRVRSCAALICVLLFLAATVLHLCMLIVREPTIETLFAADDYEGIWISLFVALVCSTVALLSFTDAREWLAPFNRHAMSFRASVALVAPKARVLMLVVVRPLLSPVRMPSDIDMP